MNTPKSQNPEGKVVAVSRYSMETARFNEGEYTLMSKHPDGDYVMWFDHVGVVSEMQLQFSAALITIGNQDDAMADMQRRFSDLELAATALADAVQEETDYLASTPARALSGITMAAHDNRVMEFTRNLRRTLLRDGKGDGVSTAEGESK